MYYDRNMQYGKFASVYDSLMTDFDRDAWAEYLLSFIPNGASVAECACGTGEMSLRLAKAGRRVTASDISEQMLYEAAKKQREAGLANADLRFVRMDMRRLALHRKVDFVVACCDGVNYLTSPADVRAFFRAAHDSLVPGGMLLFDVSSRYKLSEVLGCNCFVDNGEETAYLWQNVYDESSKLIRMELSFFKKQGALYERFDETHIQRAHSEREIGSWLDNAGFEYEAYRAFTREPVSPNDERIQFAARKRNE